MAETKNKETIAARINAELRGSMQEFADRNKLPLSWVMERCLELGWPLFLQQPLSGVEEKTA